MKRSISKFIKGATLALLVLVSQSMAFAAVSGPDVIKKAREAVSTSPNNWYILAQSADACLKQGLNVEEAGEWIEKSLTMEKNVYTMEVMGDYYLETKQPKKALGYFINCLEMTEKSDSKSKFKRLQSKIVTASKMQKGKS